MAHAVHIAEPRYRSIPPISCSRAPAFRGRSLTVVIAGGIVR